MGYWDTSTLVKLYAKEPDSAVKLIPTKTHFPISRREFFISTVVGLTVMKFDPSRAQESSSTPFLERLQSGTPHKGKVLAAIQPHSDDVALLCSGTVAKLIQELQRIRRHCRSVCKSSATCLWGQGWSSARASYM